MKKIMVILFTVGLLFVETGLAGVYHEVATRVMDDLTIKVLMDNNPPVVGDNNLNIILTDSKQNPVTDAKIKIGYSMPPMDNMPPMNYKTRAKFDTNGYKAKINLSMSGPWDITVYIKRAGKSLTKMSFRVKVP